MNLQEYLRDELTRLMKRRDKVALRAVRDAISAIQNAETAYVTPAAVAAANVHVAGTVAFGHAERVISELPHAEVMDIARAEATRRLEEAAHLRELGDIDAALMLKAEALALSDRLDAYPG